MEVIANQAPEGFVNKAKIEQVSALLDGGGTVAPVVEKKPDLDLAIDNDLDSDKPQDKPALDLAIDQGAAPETANNDADPEADDAAVNENEEVNPVNLKDLAATLQVDQKDLYKVEIPIGSDESATLGELKDSHKELKKINATRADYDENRERSENELLVSRRQVSQLIEMSRNAGILTPEILNSIDNTHAENLSRERAALMNVIPGWKDTATRDVEFGDIVSILGEYGISKREIENSIDHRMVKFVHDQVRKIMNIRAAKLSPDVPTNLRGNGRKTKKPTALEIRTANAKRSGKKADKLAAVSTLLNRI